MNAQELHTARLRLRHWLPADRDPFAALNADPRVSEFLSSPLAREQSDALADRIEAHWAEHGFGLWALEIPSVAPFAGMIVGVMILLRVPFVSDRSDETERPQADRDLRS